MQGLTPHEQALAADGGKRAAVIQGLIDVAAFLASHPGVPIPASVIIHYSVLSGEHSEVDRIAGEAHAGIHGDGGYYEAVRDFGPVRYKAIAIDSDVTAAWDETMQAFRATRTAPAVAA